MPVYKAGPYSLLDCRMLWKPISVNVTKHTKPLVSGKVSYWNGIQMGNAIRVNSDFFGVDSKQFHGQRKQTQTKVSYM